MNIATVLDRCLDAYSSAGHAPDLPPGFRRDLYVAKLIATDRFPGVEPDLRYMVEDGDPIALPTAIHAAFEALRTTRADCTSLELSVWATELGNRLAFLELEAKVDYPHWVAPLAAPEGEEGGAS